MTWQMAWGAKTNTESHKIKLRGSIAIIFICWVAFMWLFSNFVDSIGISLLFIWFCRFLYFLGFIWVHEVSWSSVSSWLNYVADTLVWLANKLVLIELLGFCDGLLGIWDRFLQLVRTVIFIIGNLRVFIYLFQFRLQ